MATHTPIRTCIACGTKSDKRSLLRVVRGADGSVCVDASGKAAGRGAYVCKNAKCFEAARKKRTFESKLRVKISAAAYDRLEEEFSTVCTESANTCSRDGE